MMAEEKKHIVAAGETIYDVAYNTIGSIYAIDALLDDNGIETYTPEFEADRELLITGEVQNNAAVLRASIKPFNSSLIPPEILRKMLDEIVYALTPPFYSVAHFTKVIAIYGNTKSVYKKVLK